MTEDRSKFIRIDSDFITAQYSIQFGAYFIECIGNDLRNYTSPKDSNILVEKIEKNIYQFGKKKNNETIEESHFKCAIDSMQNCFRQ